MRGFLSLLNNCLGESLRTSSLFSVQSDINQSISCVKADPFLINRPSFQCETHRRNEKWYVNGCCDSSFCSSNLTLDTTKMFDDKG